MNLKYLRELEYMINLINTRSIKNRINLINTKLVDNRIYFKMFRNKNNEISTRYKELKM